MDDSPASEWIWKASVSPGSRLVPRRERAAHLVVHLEGVRPPRQLVRVDRRVGGGHCADFEGSQCVCVCRGRGRERKRGPQRRGGSALRPPHFVPALLETRPTAERRKMHSPVRLPHPVTVWLSSSGSALPLSAVPGRICKSPLRALRPLHGRRHKSSFDPSLLVPQLPSLTTRRMAGRVALITGAGRGIGLAAVRCHRFQRSSTTIRLLAGLTSRRPHRPSFFSPTTSASFCQTSIFSERETSSRARAKSGSGSSRRT